FSERDCSHRRKALQALQRYAGESHLPDQMAAFGISGGFGQGLKRLFMSHPPLQERIEALKQQRGA
ncbi:MAG: hypothetical protein ACOCUM_01025, partial [Thiohalospira sp.]